MGVRCFLTLTVRTAANMIDQAGSVSQRPVLLNREYRHIAAHIIRHQQIASRSINIAVTRRAAPRRPLVDKRQRTVSFVDAKRAYGSGWLTAKVVRFIACKDHVL